MTLLIGLALVGAKLRDTYKYHYGFDQQEWSTLSIANQTRLQQDDKNERAAMVPDLLAHYLHVGMTRPAVRQLLGEPDEHYLASDSLTAPATSEQHLTYQYQTYLATQYGESDRFYIELQFTDDRLTHIKNVAPMYP
ncbi:MAG: hypothetical protein ACRYF0_09485 [Janthinobacterium lividum]